MKLGTERVQACTR